MNVRRKARQVIAVILCITLSIGLMPEQIYAKANSEDKAQVIKEYEVGDVTCSYREISTWGNSVNAEISLTNKGSAPVYNWSADFSYDGIIDNIWNADIKSSENHTYVIGAKDYNSNIKPGATVSFGIISHGENDKPSIPDKINIYNENGVLLGGTPDENQGTLSDANQEDEAEKIEKTEDSADTHIELPEELRGLNYALLSGNETVFAVNANMLNVNGDVHTNSGFAYSGNSISVSGVLEAVNDIRLNTSSAKDSQKIGEKKNNSEKIPVPDILGKIYEYARENGEYSSEYVTYNAEEIAVSRPIVTDSGASFNGTSFIDRGVIYAKENISFNLNSFATPAGARIFIASENGDINISGTDVNLNAVIYAPNGNVNINLNTFNLNGRIIAKHIYMNGTSLNINAGPYDYELVDFLYKPEFEIKVSGNQKENRRLELDLEESTTTSSLENGVIEWKITKDGYDESYACYAFDEKESGKVHKELIVREAGVYNVSAAVSVNGSEYTVSKEVVIEKDVQPEAVIKLDGESFYRDENGNAVIPAADISYSSDGDYINSRRWYLYYDRDNNGEYDDHEKTVISEGNEEAPEITADMVGKYKLCLEVTEGFRDTIPSLIDESAYKKSYTYALFEVENKKPTATVSLKKAKKADIVFTVGNCSEEELAVYNKKAEEIKNTLEEKGIDTRIDTASTKLYTAQDKFAWKEYTHYDYGYNHIEYNENEIKMLGYERAPNRDFLYVDSSYTGKKRFSFDLERDKANWHSMQGGGFLFNTTIDEENDLISGYCLIVDMHGLSLFELDNAYLSALTNGGYYNMYSAGEKIATAYMYDLLDKHHITIEVDGDSFSMWDGDEIKFDHFVLPKKYGNGFGPITCYFSHSCEYISYFTFSDIKMETVSGTSLSEVVDDYAWRSDATRYVINLSSDSVPELSDNEDMAKTAATLIQEDVTVIGIGNKKNEKQFRQLINITDGNGQYRECTDIASDMDGIADMIENAVMSKDYTINDLITKDVTVEYDSIFKDPDGDEMYDQEWEYEYDPGIFDKASGSGERITKTVSEPVKQFEESGAYTIRLRVRDNPFKNKETEAGTPTDAEEEINEDYLMWSDTAESERLLIVQNRPVASVTADVTLVPDDRTKCSVNVRYEAYDEDHAGDSKRGIREEYFYYKKLNDSTWTEGRIPGTIAMGDTYLVKYQVKDAEGTLSFPAVIAINTEDYKEYEKIVDVNPPKVIITPEKYEISVGEKIQIEAYGEDDYGVCDFELYIGEELALGHEGRCFYTPGKEGTVTLKGVATDIGGNRSQGEVVIKVTDKSDKTPPKAVITAPSSEADIDFGVVEFIGTADDETKLLEYTLGYKSDEESEYHIFARGDEPVTEDKLGELDISSLNAGNYSILLSVRDEAGNEGYYVIGLNIEKGEGAGDDQPGNPEGGNTPPTARIENIAFSENNAYINVYATIADDEYIRNWNLELSDAEGEEGKSVIASGTDAVDNEIIGTISTEELVNGDYRFRLTAYDNKGSGSVFTMLMSFVKGEKVETSEDTKTEDTPSGKKKLAVSLSKYKAKSGEEVQVYVTLPEGEDESELKIYQGEHLIEEGSKKSSFISGEPGEETITARLGEKSAKAVVFIYDDQDVALPTVEFNTPESDEVIIKPADITGSVYDEEGLYSYKLEARLEGSGEDGYSLIAEGNSEIRNGVIGHFDTTLLPNGIYELRITAKDKGGNTSRRTRKVTVDGRLKIGAMNIGFTDITNKLSGVTVNVNRMYSSMNKDESGEFGYGWKLGMLGLKTYESGDIWLGYEVVQSGSVFSKTYQIRETEKHDVLINYGDGTSDRFRLCFTPEKSVLVPLMETKLTYRCVTNPKLKLEFVADSTAYIEDGMLNFYDEAMYDDLSYKLITEDENEIYINSYSGVYKIVSKDGNVIIVDKNGYHSQDGKSITLERDSKNRITKATDIHGKTTTYTYDKSGNLASVITDDGKCVSYTYDKEHNLVSITDPNGVAIARNEYDENGRLIATIDADGNRIEFEHGLDDNTEIVRDRRGNATVMEYDDQGNIICTTDPYGNKTKSTFDENGNQLSITDANGNTTNYAYNSDGNITTVTSPTGETVYTDYSSGSNVSTIRTADKTLFTADYNNKGVVSNITDSNGNKTDYEYDADGNLTGLTDTIGTVQTVTYDGDGNVKTVTNGAGDTTTYTYNEDGKCTGTSVVNRETGEVFTSKNVYDESGKVSESIDSQGNVTKYEYDENGNNTAIIDSKNRRFTYEYDTYGNVIKSTYPDGTYEVFEYDENGNNTVATDRNGLTVTMEYDKLDRLTKKTYPDGTKESYSYDAVGNLIEKTAVNGAVTKYAYNELNQNISLTDALGNTTTFTYDDMGRQSGQTDPLGNQISFEYDGNGNITKTTFADGSYVTSTYDARDRVTKQADANGNETSYTYDGADRLISVEDALGNKYSYDYDQNGSLIKVTDPLGHETKYTYDSMGRVVGTENALGKKATNTYDESGKLVEATTFAGNKTKYTYDDMDRAIKIEAGSEVIEYTYDEKDILTKVSKNDRDTTFTYNEYGQLTSKTDENNKTVTYEYNQFGQLKTFNNGFSDTSYEYDKLGRVTRVIDKNGKATVYEYDANGNKTAVRYPNGTVMSYTYDACNRLKEEALTNASGKLLAKYSYTLGKAGERLSITEEDVSGNIINTSYKYDALNRLVSEEIKDANGSIVNEYTYDSVSNRTSKKTTVTGDIKKIADTKDENCQIIAGETTYEYSAFNQLLLEKTPAGDISYTYDEDGNLVKETGLKNAEYEYNPWGKLEKATVKKDNKIVVETYEYDYNDNRIGKTVDGIETRYVVDETYTYTKVVAEYDSEGNIKADYTIGDDIISAEINGKEHYYVYDGHGDVRYLADDKGSFTDSYSYDAYGVLIKKIGDTENDFLYCGEQYNESTGLYYLRARYMNPSTGTFISMDSYAGSIYDPVSLHKYLYANANPVMNIDPSGYSALSNLTVTQACSFILDSAATILVGALFGALAGALISGIDYALGAGKDFSWKELWNEMKLGMLMGWMLGAVIATLTVFAPIYALVGGILIVTESLMVVAGGIGVVISLAEGKTAQALFRALLLFFAYKGLKKSIDKYGSKAWESLKSLGKKLGDSIIEVTNKTKGSNSYSEGFEAWLNKGISDNKVYFGIKKGKAVYTGITKQTLKARLSQHNAKGKGFQTLRLIYDNLTRNQARAIEQYYIENGPNELNKINSISPKNKFYEDALNWAEEYLGGN